MVTCAGGRDGVREGKEEKGREDGRMEWICKEERREMEISGRKEGLMRVREGREDGWDENGGREGRKTVCGGGKVSNA